MRAVLPIFLFLVASSAFGRIGETLYECQTRYGTMIGTDMTHPNYPAYVFQKDGIEIRVRLYNGKSAQEIFFGIGSELTTDQLRQFQAVNLTSDATVHCETVPPVLEEKRAATLGLKILKVDPNRPHFLGTNRQDGNGFALVFTTAEFDKVLGGMTGF